MESSKPRFVVKAQVVVEDKACVAGKRLFSHLDVCHIDNGVYVKASQESKRRIQHVIDGSIDGVVKEMIRKRDEAIDELIRKSIVDADPMLESQNVDLSQMAPTTRQKEFEKAKVPDTLSISFDRFNIANDDKPLGPHKIRVASTSVLRGSLIFEILPENLEWISKAVKVDWEKPDDTCPILDMVYKCVEFDWDRVVAYFCQSRLFFRSRKTFLNKDGKRSLCRASVPKKLLQDFKNMDQVAADKIGKIANQVAERCAGGPSDGDIANASDENREDAELDSSESPLKA